MTPKYFPLVPGMGATELDGDSTAEAQANSAESDVTDWTLGAQLKSSTVIQC